MNMLSSTWEKIKRIYYRIMISKKVNKIFWRIGFVYETNNNIWLIIWPIFFFHLLFNLIVFGIGPEVSSLGPSDFFGKAYGDYLSNIGLTGYGNLPLYLKVWYFGPFVWIRCWFAWISWKLCFLEFIFSILVVWVLRDEVQRAGRAAWKIARERRNKRIIGGEKDTHREQTVSGAPQTAGATQQMAQQQGFFQRPVSLRNFLLMDFAVEFLQQLGFIRRIHQI